MATTIKRALHAHGCVQCHGRYTDTCGDRDGNQRCSACRGLRGWALLISNAQPRDCCRVHSRLVSKADFATYQLSKGCSWWICSVCARTHPYAKPLDVSGDPS